MTNGCYGRITGLQTLVLGVAGRVLQFADETDSVPESTRLKVMRMSYRALCNKTGADFGYDLAAWHEHLQSTSPHNESYMHPYAWAGVSRAIVELIDDPDRIRLADLIESEDNA